MASEEDKATGNLVASMALTKYQLDSDAENYVFLSKYLALLGSKADTIPADVMKEILIIYSQQALQWAKAADQVSSAVTSLVHSAKTGDEQA